jgi:hypothetical protein
MLLAMSDSLNPQIFMEKYERIQIWEDFEKSMQYLWRFSINYWRLYYWLSQYFSNEEIFFPSEQI